MVDLNLLISISHWSVSEKKHRTFNCDANVCDIGVTYNGQWLHLIEACQDDIKKEKAVQDILKTIFRFLAITNLGTRYIKFSTSFLPYMDI